MAKTRDGHATWGVKQRNELNRRFALYHEDPTHPDGVPYEKHLLHSDYTKELHAKIPCLAECDPRYVTGPTGHINKRAALFRSDLEEAGARRRPREFSIIFVHSFLSFSVSNFFFFFFFYQPTSTDRKPKKPTKRKRITKKKIGRRHAAIAPYNIRLWPAVVPHRFGTPSIEVIR